MIKRDTVLWLSSIDVIGQKTMKNIFEVIGYPERIHEIDLDTLKGYVNNAVIEKLKESDFERDIKKYKERLEKAKVSFVTLWDKDYPERLKYIPDQPYILFYKGDISLASAKHSVAMVGARGPSQYGVDAAKDISGGLARKGAVIVSGMASGIDSICHRAAIDAGGKTIAVLGSGINVCYPRCNIGLYSEICENHLVISENGLDIEPFPYSFPIRNRIVSGLSDGVAVIEAREKSGSLITAELALAQNKNLYALPGRIYDPLSKGTNALLREGAAMAIDSCSSIIKDVFMESDESPEINNILSIDISDKEKAIFKVFGSDEIYIDDLIAMTGLKSGELMSLLIRLEQKKMIKETERGYYQKIRR